MKNEEYKKLSIKEFTKAAGRYESNHAGIYEMCKKDYPDILEELEKVFLLMGCSKNYIMYWGVFTVFIVPCVHQKVCTKFTKFNIFFCAFYSFVFATSSFSVVKSASNSSRCIFSFSRRRAAQL